METLGISKYLQITTIASAIILSGCEKEIDEISTSINNIINATENLELPLDDIYEIPGYATANDNENNEVCYLPSKNIQYTSDYLNSLDYNHVNALYDPIHSDGHTFINEDGTILNVTYNECIKEPK